MRKFKYVKVGESFRFPPFGLLGLATGPFVKTSHRTYTDDPPRMTERYRSADGTTLEPRTLSYTVGSVNAPVMP